MAASIAAHHALDTLNLGLGYGVTSGRRMGVEEVVLHLDLGGGRGGVWMGTLSSGQAYALGRDLLLHVDHLAGSERAERELQGRRNRRG